MTLSKDRIGAFALLIFCIAYGYFSQDIRLLPFQLRDAFHARTMPEALTVLGVALSVILIVSPGSNETPKWGGLNWGLVAVFLGLMSLYGFSLRPFGFIFSTIVFLVVGFAILGERRPGVALGVAVPMAFGFWQLMERLLSVVIHPWPFGYEDYFDPVDGFFDIVFGVLGAVWATLASLGGGA